MGIRQGFLGGVTVGITNCIFFCSWALALWFGSTRIVAGSYTGGGMRAAPMLADGNACMPACVSWHCCLGGVDSAHDAATCVHTI